jgi:hypothetical protein
MSNADDWSRAHTIWHNRTAKKAEAEKLTADREAFLATGGEIDVRDATGRPTKTLPAFMSGYSVDDMKARSKKGAKKSHRTLAAKESKG